MSVYSIPHSLQTAILNKRVLLFIGAGISKQVGLPLWNEIVIKTLRNPSVNGGEHYIGAIENDVITPLEALDKIKDKSKKEIYSTFEAETSQKINSDLYGLLKRISGKMVTTNYDKLIEHNCHIPVISPSSAYSLQKLDASNEFLLKVHGDCNEIDNAVIFTSDYESLYAEHGGLAKFQLEKMVSVHTCLFLGFSMTDNFVSNLFDRLGDMYKGLGPDHFAISTNQIHHKFVKTITISSYSELPEIIEHLGKFNSEIVSENIKEDKNETPGPECMEGTESLTSGEALEDGIKIVVGNDTPPIIDNWAGRIDELKSLKAEYKVCFVTGIGGQGKSALASRLLSQSNRNEYEFIAWRDFKEEQLNFQSKLYQLIELVSNRSKTNLDVIGYSTDELVDTFFESLGRKKGVFVFDNIDRYIDLEKFLPTGDMAYFFEKALRMPHASKFVFTCRPFIHFAGINFYQVKLEGMELSDVKELIGNYHKDITDDRLDTLATQLHQATNGHPLWMSLILAQSRSGLDEIDAILNKIAAKHATDASRNISGLISAAILEDVWKKLKDKQKIVLRTLSISNVAEKEEDLAKIVERKVNFNQFAKALKSLKSFNLIVEKEGTGYIELHPLVREFIKANYAREEQESFITLYVNYLDGVMLLIKSKLGKVLGVDDLDLIIKKIEILISAEKIPDAVNELRLTSESLRISGYSEELIRLCDLLFSKNIWNARRIDSIPGFQAVVGTFFDTCANFSCYELFDKYMGKFLSVFFTADANMILAKSSVCHKEWLRGNYAEAIKAGKSASDLIDIIGEGDIWLGKHRYYLALRDRREPEGIKKALAYFIGTRSLGEYLSTEDSIEVEGSAYGNVGRCLLYLGEYENAIFLMVKSYRTLNSRASFFNSHNLGYASKWMYEMLTSSGKPIEAIYFLRYAITLWKHDIPVEANRLELEFSKLNQTSVVQSIASLENWQIKKYCDDWIEKFFITYKSSREVSVN